MKKIYILLSILVFALTVFGQNGLNNSQLNLRNTTTGTSSVQSFSISKVYPNPVKDRITVDLYSDLSGEIQLSLFNILGTEVKKWKSIYISQGNQQILLELNDIKTGIYILKITQSGQIATQVLKKI